MGILVILCGVFLWGYGQGFHSGLIYAAQHKWEAYLKVKDDQTTEWAYREIK